MALDKNYRRARVNAFWHIFGKLMLKITGWKIQGHMPDIKKSVIIVAHHTSNIDFYVGLFISFAEKIEPYWLVKHDYLRWPFKPIAKYLGGIPVFRSSKNNMVEQAADYFSKFDIFHLAITPEGSRKKGDYWKSGFYHIALKAKVPIVCAYLDYSRKIGGFGPVIKLTGKIKSDMNRIRKFYDTVSAKYPELANTVRLKEEEQAALSA